MSGMVQASSEIPAPWFEKFKDEATAEQLYNFLYLLPKGGDLHHHLSGSNFSQWWYDLAVDQKLNGGYQYYTQIKVQHCQAGNVKEFHPTANFLAFRNIQFSHYRQLSDCEKSEYKGLDKLSAAEKMGWFNSIRLDKSTEGRNEFFDFHWARLNELTNNPYIMAELLVKNMQAFAKEGLVYLESQSTTRGFKNADGSDISADAVADVFRKRLAQKDALQTGVVAKLQYPLLRFLPKAEQELEWIYAFVDKHRDLFVGINMVGREDNDKGYPLRFLPTLRKLRRTLPAINLAIHGGEVDEPNSHVRDTLLLGATRIGHGVNLIDDADTMLLMRNNSNLLEINLISNLLLEYVSEYSQHPFPEYLRTGIPVALSTDDRGMWDSTMTDEYYVAVKEFNLSWQELISLAENSLKYSFLDKATKHKVLQNYQRRIAVFRRDFEQKGLQWLQQVQPEKRAFICNHYQLCTDK